MILKDKLKEHGEEISSRIDEIENQIGELRGELRQLKELKRVLDPDSVQKQSRKKK